MVEVVSLIVSFMEVEIVKIRWLDGQKKNKQKNKKQLKDLAKGNS